MINSWHQNIPFRSQSCSASSTVQAICPTKRERKCIEKPLSISHSISILVCFTTYLERLMQILFGRKSI